MAPTSKRLAFGLQRGAAQRRRKTVFKRSGDAKLYSSRVAEKVSSVAIELFGGYGYVKIPGRKILARLENRAIYEGTSNMQLQTIAN